MAVLLNPFSITMLLNPFSVTELLHVKPSPESLEPCLKLEPDSRRYGRQMGHGCTELNLSHGPQLKLFKPTISTSNITFTSQADRGSNISLMCRKHPAEKNDWICDLPIHNSRLHDGFKSVST